MKKLLATLLLAFTCSVFASPEFPKIEDLEWTGSFPVDEFETLCIETDRANKDSMSVFVVIYPSLETWNKVKEKHEEIDEIKAWSLREGVNENDDYLWISGWGLFKDGKLLELIPMRSNINYKKIKNI